jgi:type IV conjugative transfer system protein TraE
MKASVFEAKYNRVVNHRMGLILLCGFLALTNILSGALNLKQHGSERVIISPPTIEQKFWVAGDEFSDSYLSQMAEYFSWVLLSINPNNAEDRISKLLTHVAPGSYSKIKAELVSQVDVVRERGFNSSFTPVSTSVSRNELKVEVKGMLDLKVNSQRIESTLKTFEVVFASEHGKLLIKAISLKEDI